MPDIPSEFLRYSIQKTPGACLDIVLACAKDGALHWQDLFQHGLSEVIAGDLRLERRLFRHLCIDAVQDHGNAILSSYLGRLSPEHHKRLFTSEALMDKNHPVSYVFSRAAFATSGTLALELLGTFIKAGLSGGRLQELAKRRNKDVQQACRLGNQNFLDFLLPKLQPIPDTLLEHIVASETHGPSIVSRLIQSGTVTFAAFNDPKVLRSANQNVSMMLSALAARSTREKSRFSEKV
jgi:hypothetical protein